MFLLWNSGVTLVAAVNKTNFMSIRGQWSCFDGLCDRISSICVVLRGNFACVFARLLLPVCNGG